MLADELAACFAIAGVMSAQRRSALKSPTKRSIAPSRGARERADASLAEDVADLGVDGVVEAGRERVPVEDGVEEAWRIVDPVLRKPSTVQIYECGSWGPLEAGKMTEKLGGWHAPQQGSGAAS